MHPVYGNPINRCQDISLKIPNVDLMVAPTEKSYDHQRHRVMFSENIWISIAKFMAIHPLVVEIFQSRPIDSVIPRNMLRAWLKISCAEPLSNISKFILLV